MLTLVHYNYWLQPINLSERNCPFISCFVLQADVGNSTLCTCMLHVNCAIELIQIIYYNEYFMTTSKSNCVSHFYSSGDVVVIEFYYGVFWTSDTTV